MKTIESISLNQLCTGCGTCAGVCPSNAISMVKSHSGLIEPFVDKKKCTECRNCILVCPGYQLDLSALSHCLDSVVDDSLLGGVYDCYWGYSKDKSIRHNSASGGLCSEILIYALENKIIDGALITKMDEKNPLESKPFIAKSKQEILDASKSKYCPVSTNELLSYILKEDGKFAVVGLPCHIHGIRKAQNLIPSLRKKIVLCLGLMCSHTVSYTGTEYLMEKLGVDKKSISQIDYRGKGWPGSMSIQTNNSSKTIPLVGSWKSYWCFFSSFFFAPIRCTTCPDQNAELADFSLGDAWLPELRRDHVGSSVIVTRTKFADGILKDMAKSNQIRLWHLSIEKVIQSQRLNLKFKKNWIGTRLALLKSQGKRVPNLNPVPKQSFKPLDLLRAFYPYFGIFSSSNKQVRFFVKHAPLPLFRLYFGVFKYLGK